MVEFVDSLIKLTFTFIGHPATAKGLCEVRSEFNCLIEFFDSLIELTFAVVGIAASIEGSRSFTLGIRINCSRSIYHRFLIINLRRWVY